LAVVLDAIEQVGGQFNLDVSNADTITLIGDAGVFDSLAFVNFVALVEEACEKRFGAQLCLTGNSPLDGSQERFDSASALASFIVRACMR
jgi:acyl carrier protein